MTKKIITIFSIYILIGISISACGLLEVDKTICDIEFAALNQLSKPNKTEPDEFDDKIGFEIISIDHPNLCALSNIQLFSQAYATKKCAVFQNNLLELSYNLSFDKLIIMNNDTIHPNTNILDLPYIRSLTIIETEYECLNVISKIIFKEELINKLKFEKGEYVTNFRCSTNDEKIFIKSRRVIFKK